MRVWQIQLDPNTHYRPAPYRGDRPPCELSNITSVILNPATPYLYGIDRGLSLIEDLLVLAKEGESVGEVEVVNLGAVVERCWGSVEAADATITVAVDGAIWADESRLTQLLENLLRNAVQHGGEDVAVEVGSLSDGFYVADDGPGIPEGDRERVFDPGYSSSDEGNGLGLNIVREIAEAHGWTVRVTDSKRGGARFELTGLEPIE